MVWYSLEPWITLLYRVVCNGRINAAMHDARQPVCQHHPTPRGWLQGGAVGRLRHRQRCYLLPPYTCLTVPRFVLLLRRSHLDRRSTELARPTRFTDAVLTPLYGRWLSVCVSVVARPYPPKSPTADKAIAFVPQEGRTPIVVATTSSRRLYQLVQSTQ
jgi:hypothetical protein